MNKISGKELNLLKTLEILKSNRFVSFYHFNNLSKREWDTIKLQLRKIETQDGTVNKNREGLKEKEFKKKVLPPIDLLVDRTARYYVQSNNLSKKELLVKIVGRNSNKDIKGVTTKRELKGTQVELLVLKSRAVVKALYPFLFYSQICQGVEQTVDILNPALLVGRAVPSAKFANSFAEQRAGDPLRATVPTRINSLINAFYLIEGPTLLVGTSTVEGFKESARQLEKEKGLVFVGGVLENQFINHLDLKDCLKTFLPSSANFLQTLNSTLMIPPLSYYSNKLLFLLQKRRKSLKKGKL